MPKNGVWGIHTSSFVEDVRVGVHRVDFQTEYNITLVRWHDRRNNVRYHCKEWQLSNERAVEKLVLPYECIVYSNVAGNWKLLCLGVLLGIMGLSFTALSWINGRAGVRSVRCLEEFDHQKQSFCDRHSLAFLGQHLALLPLRDAIVPVGWIWCPVTTSELVKLVVGLSSFQRRSRAGTISQISWSNRR